jgi:hypothetical protein
VELLFVTCSLPCLIMKGTKDLMRIGLAVACFLAATAAYAAQDACLGSWFYQKSETAITSVQTVLTPSGQLGLAAETVPETYQLTYEALPDGTMKITGDGLVVNGQIAKGHWEWVGKFDGNDYPVTGDPSADTRAYSRVDDQTLKVTVKKGGNVAKWGNITIRFKGKKCTASAPGETAYYRRK